jgi:hypothetical protein
MEFKMKLLVIFISLCVCLSLISCDSCDGENPSVQLINNGTGKADIQIKTSDGNTENINNVEPGTSSERRTFANYCNDYTVTINPDNSVTSSGQER